VQRGNGIVSVTIADVPADPAKKVSNIEQGLSTGHSSSTPVIV